MNMQWKKTYKNNKKFKLMKNINIDGVPMQT